MSFVITHGWKKSGGGYSAEAQAVINRMTGLTLQEMNAIAAFVDAEVLNNNWSLVDEFFCFKFFTEANALKGWKTKTATNVGALKVTEGLSINAGGIKYIDTNFNPTNDAVNYSLNNGMYGHFMYETTFANYLFYNMGGNNQLRIQTTTSQFNLTSLNGNSGTPVYISVPATDPNTYIQVVRSSSASLQTYINGVNHSTNNNSRLSTAIPNANQIVGHTSSGQSIKGTRSTWIIGAANGFNFSAHYTNLTTLLNALN